MSQEPAPGGGKPGGIFTGRNVAIALAALIVAVAVLVWLGLMPGIKPVAGGPAQQTMADNAAPNSLAPPQDAANPGRMKLEAQYAGPFQGTLIQRWRDPIDGRVCYLYIPVIAKHSPADANGLVDYGPNTIGSISCTGPGRGMGGGGGGGQ